MVYQDYAAYHQAYPHPNIQCGKFDGNVGNSAAGQDHDHMNGRPYNVGRPSYIAILHCCHGYHLLRTICHADRLQDRIYDTARSTMRSVQAELTKNLTISNIPSCS
jgi:hypothetical protein